MRRSTAAGPSIILLVFRIIPKIEARVLHTLRELLLVSPIARRTTSFTSCLDLRRAKRRCFVSGRKSNHIVPTGKCGSVARSRNPSEERDKACGAILCVAYAAFPASSCTPRRPRKKAFRSGGNRRLSFFNHLLRRSANNCEASA